MRIISGSFKGKTLASVGKGDPSAQLRPTTDRVRESIFNLLVNGGYGDPISKMRVLDLFAGTGALGFEALSRGAAFCLSVDQGGKARALLRENAALLGLGAEAKILSMDATNLGTSKIPSYDLVFLDPPYGKQLGEKSLASALNGGWLAQNALIVWEENSEQFAPKGFRLLDNRRYGETWVHILELE